MKKEEILSKCLDEIQSGRSSLEDCLSRYPELRDGLQPLLEIAASIRPQKVTASSEFKRKLRVRLQEIMETTPARDRRATGWQPRVLLPARAFGILLTCLIIVLLLVSATTTVYASQNSLPDDVLYPVKISSEKIQLAMKLNHEDKANLRLQMAERRIDEVAAESIKKQSVNKSALVAATAQIDGAVREMGKASEENTKAFASRLAESSLHQQIVLDQVAKTAAQPAQLALQQALDAAKQGSIIAQITYENPEFLRSVPSVQDDLESGRFKIEGVLRKANENIWEVGGVALDNVISPSPAPAEGTPVKLEGFSSRNRVYITDIEQEETASDQVKIEGVFNGTSSGGTTWYVSGIPVAVPSGEVSPTGKEKLQISGTMQDGQLKETQIERKPSDRKEKTAELEGELNGVDINNNTITVSTAGNSVVINIGQADIKSEDGKRLVISNLTALMGKGVKADGVYRKGDSLYAREVTVDVEAYTQKDTSQNGNKNKGIEKDSLSKHDDTSSWG